VNGVVDHRAKKKSDAIFLHFSFFSPELDGFSGKDCSKMVLELQIFIPNTH